MRETTLEARLETVFDRGVDTQLPDFDALAVDVFRYQFETNTVYRRFAEGRGRTPATVEEWREIPAVPTRAFKRLRLVSGEGPVERTFRTSGTTSTTRGEHHVRSLDLYRAASLPNLRANLLGDVVGVPSLPVLCLLPSPADAPDSSLSTMMGFAVEAWGTAASGWFVDPLRGVRTAELDRAVRAVVAAGAPVLLAGTAFSFVHWLDALDSSHVLPEGSRLLETGGFKGRSREVARADLYAALGDRLGVPPGRIVNEYGMTELLSQFYEPVLAGGTPAEPVGERHHRPPPWTRTRVLDPHTLEPVRRGEPGLLCHLDLANVGSVACVLTEDLGVEVEDGFRVLGRVGDAEPRGCSLAMEELGSAAGWEEA